MFSSKKVRAPLFNKSIHFLPIVQIYSDLKHPKPRAHGVRYARGFGEPLKIYHGLSFFFLRAFFFFLLRKKEEKREIVYKKNNLRKNKNYLQYATVA